MTPHCARAALVLSRFLDGDPSGDDPDGDPLELAGHLRGCAICRVALQNARRLDALLAQNSGVAVPPELADRLLTEAVSPVTAAPRRRRLVLSLGGAALLLI